MYKSNLNPYSRPVTRANEGGVPITMYGYTPVYNAPPDITDETGMQENNINKAKKINLKESSELKSNYIGVCTTRMPRVPEKNYQSLQVVNLIDNNPETCWCSHIRIRPDEYPVWIRLDFAKNTKIKRVVIKKRPITFDRKTMPVGSTTTSPGAQEIGRAMAKKIKISSSVDALNWETLFDGIVDRENLDEFIFDFSSIPSKQLMIEGNDLDTCENFCHAFSVANIEVYDDRDKNIALFSKGTGISTNSVYHGSSEGMETAWHWHLHENLGIKWSRIGYHDDPINWHWVETEKGKLVMDELAEEAINTLVRNNINIIYCLGFGNRLYEGYIERYLPQLNEWYYENPQPPKSEEALKAWDDFVRFSVNYFKDRIKWFEIWNEWDGINYWGAEPDVDHYLIIAKRTIKIIRELAPDSKIVLGSCSKFVHHFTEEDAQGSMEIVDPATGKVVFDRAKHQINMFYRAISELAPYVDAIGYHPFYQPNLKWPRFIEYADNIKAFKKHCESKGFKGNTYMASEFAVGAMYPPTVKGTPGCWWGERGSINYSEIEKAKIITQLNVKHSALGVHSMLCELNNHNYPLELSLLRKGFDSYPIQALNPSMAYFTVRNSCTILNEYEPAEFNVTCSENIKDIFTMKKPGANAITLWTNETVCDCCEGIKADLIIDFEAKSARIYDFINGTVTELNISVANGKTFIKGIIVRDCPEFIELDI